MKEFFSWLLHKLNIVYAIPDRYAYYSVNDSQLHWIIFFLNQQDLW